MLVYDHEQYKSEDASRVRESSGFYGYLYEEEALYKIYLNSHFTVQHWLHANIRLVFLIRIHPKARFRRDLLASLEEV